MVNLGEEFVKQTFEKMLKFHILAENVNYFNYLIFNFLSVLLIVL